MVTAARHDFPTNSRTIEEKFNWNEKYVNQKSATHKFELRCDSRTPWLRDKFQNCRVCLIVYFASI